MLGSQRRHALGGSLSDDPSMTIDECTGIRTRTNFDGVWQCVRGGTWLYGSVGWVAVATTHTRRRRLVRLGEGVVDAHAEARSPNGIDGNEQWNKK